MDKCSGVEGDGQRATLHNREMFRMSWIMRKKKTERCKSSLLKTVISHSATERIGSIRFYLKCWIIRQAAQNVLSIPRKGKGKIRARSPAVSESEHSGIESPATTPPPAHETPSNLPIRASHAQMGLGSESVHVESIGTQTITFDGTNIGISVNPKAHAPLTPNKRKSVHEPPTSGKQQKVFQAARATTCAPREKQHINHNGLTRSATVSFPARLSGLDPRRQRENSDDTDRTWAPRRSGTVDTETVVDEDEVMADTGCEWSPGATSVYLG
jgi:hypothetical protein